MGALNNKFNENILITSLDKLLNWSRSGSEWYFQFGLACWFIGQGLPEMG